MPLFHFAHYRLMPDIIAICWSRLLVFPPLRAAPLAGAPRMMPSEAAMPDAISSVYAPIAEFRQHTRRRRLFLQIFFARHILRYARRRLPDMPALPGAI